MSMKNPQTLTFTSEEKFVTIFLYPAFFNWKFIHLNKIFSGGRLINSSTSFMHMEIYKGKSSLKFKPIIQENITERTTPYTLLSSTNSTN